MESFQKRDRDRKKMQKRTEKDARRKERAEMRRREQNPGGVPQPAPTLPSMPEPLSSASTPPGAG